MLEILEVGSGSNQSFPQLPNVYPSSYPTNTISSRCRKHTSMHVCMSVSVSVSVCICALKSITYKSPYHPSPLNTYLKIYLNLFAVHLIAVSHSRGQSLSFLLNNPQSFAITAFFRHHLMCAGATPHYRIILFTHILYVVLHGLVDVAVDGNLTLICCRSMCLFFCSNLSQQEYAMHIIPHYFQIPLPDVKHFSLDFNRSGLLDNM